MLLVIYKNKKCIVCNEDTRILFNYYLKCNNKICEKKFNMFIHSVFYNNKINNKTLIMVIDMFLSFVPTCIICRITGLSKQTIYGIIQKFNYDEVLVHYLDYIYLGGNENVVEIDETKLGKRKYNRGHSVEGAWVFGAVERSSKNIFVLPVLNRTKVELEGIIRKYIKPYTIIFSDCLKGYCGLKNHFFIHKTVNYSKEFVDPNNKTVHTNTIEGNWCGMK